MLSKIGRLTIITYSNPMILLWISIVCLCAPIFGDHILSHNVDWQHYEVEERQTDRGSYLARKLAPGRSKAQIVRLVVEQAAKDRSMRIQRGMPTSFDFPTTDDQYTVIQDLDNSNMGMRAHPVGEPASGMKCLIYDDNLEVSAYLQASQCTGTRRKPTDPNLPDFTDVLEAMVITETPAEPSFDNVLLRFYMQGRSAGYNPSTGRCDPECLNYKALMYRDNDAVGCATIRCSEIDAIDDRPGYVSVCHFGSSSKYDYTSKPYDAGKKCDDFSCPANKPVCNNAGLCCHGVRPAMTATVTPMTPPPWWWFTQPTQPPTPVNDQPGQIINAGGHTEAQTPPFWWLFTPPTTVVTAAQPVFGLANSVSAKDIFYNNGFQMVTRCPPGRPLNWIRVTWKKNTIYQYYEPRGQVGSFEECLNKCAMEEACYYAVMTKPKHCYVLTTTNPATCNHLSSGDYGGITEKCGLLKPCEGAYKECLYPRCQLQDLIRYYCYHRNENQAIGASCRVV